MPPDPFADAPGRERADAAGGAGASGPRGLPVRHLAALLILVAAALAAALAWWLALALGPAPWVVSVAAAAGVLVVGLPVLAWAAAQVRDARARPVVPDGPALAAVGLGREAFLDAVGREWARSRRYGSGAALLLVDVDRFARLVEARGTVATDAVLGEMLRQTAPSLRGADVLTRFSESQMAVFLAPADATGALDVAERIRERAEQLEVPLHPVRLRVTVSVGVAHLRPAHLNLMSLIEDAQDAVAAAREAGGNCVRAAPVASPALRAPGSRTDDRRTRPQSPT